MKENAVDRVKSLSKVLAGACSVVHPSARIGRGVKIWNLVYIGEDVVIGEYTSIGSLSHIDRGVSLGRRCKVQGLAYIPPNVEVGDDVFIGPAAVFLNDKYPSSGGVWSPPKLGDGVVIGGNATIMPGVVLGDGSVVGAGSVVTRDVPKGVVVAGVPAKPVLTRKQYDKKQRIWVSKRGMA